MANVYLAIHPEEMARRGRLGARKSHAPHDLRQLTRAAPAGLRARFEREVDPDGVLPKAERQRRAENARRAHYCHMARTSPEPRRSTQV